MDHTSETQAAVDPAHTAAAGVYGILGAILLVFGGLLLANIDGDLDAFLVIVALFLLSWGLYFTLAGAVALGIVLARR